MALIEDDLFEGEEMDAPQQGRQELPDTDLPWIAEKKHQSPTTPKFIGYETSYVPCAYAGWTNCYIAYRLQRPQAGTLTAFRLTFRKYQKAHNRWLRRQCYNLNTIHEAREMLRMIKAYFPELMHE